MEMVTLKNGTEEAKSLVVAVMLSLKSLMDETKGAEGALAVYELREKCRDSQHEIWGDLQQPLVRLSLISEQGIVHGSIRNVVLSAVVGEMLDMHLVSPVKTA